MPFSFENEGVDISARNCPATDLYHSQDPEIIRANLNRSPLYAGVIRGTGPGIVRLSRTRWCVLPIRTSTAFFGAGRRDTREVYVQGLSTSLPEEVQVEIYRSVIGLEHCQIMRSAYAIEYDCLDATQLTPGLMVKSLPGLFGAGQFNGSSGYEEAAAQGLIAGINAARYCGGKPPVTLDRSQAYIGVLIDDLVTKGSREPYRMMTSRAEYRLLLRQDNADARLTPLGHELGLISDARYGRFLEKQAAIDREADRVRRVTLSPTPQLAGILAQHASAPVENGAHLVELLKRPELDYEALAPVDPDRPVLPAFVREEVNIRLKYEGYIRQQERQVEQFHRLENKPLPPDLDYAAIGGLRLEAIQKLGERRPVSVGRPAASRGSPADISVLLIYLEQRRRQERKTV